jgi:hypothetical protein
VVDYLAQSRHLRSFELAGRFASCIQLSNFRQRHTRNETRPEGSSIDCLIMHQYDFTVGGISQVDLDNGGT